MVTEINVAFFLWHKSQNGRKEASKGGNNLSQCKLSFHGEFKSPMFVSLTG